MLCLRPDIVPLHSQTKSSPTPKGILQGVFADHLKVLPFAKLIIGKVKFFSTRSYVYLLGVALFSRIFAINSSDQKKILARLKKMVLEHSQKIGATRQPFLGQLLLFLPTARR